MKKLILLVVIISLGCVDQGFVDVGELPYKEEVLEVFEDTLDAGVTSLDFETYNGYIQVHVWDNQEYKIEVNKWGRGTTSEEAKERVESIQVNFSASGKTLNLEAEEIRHTGATITAYIPKKSYDTVDLSTFNGHIELGEITASDVSLNTSNGYIKAYITADSIQIDTSNGSIEGFFQGEKVDLDTSNGHIDVECGDGGQYTVDTSNGRIKIKVGSRGEFDISTSNGSIDITVTGDFDFDLKTSNASIQVAATGVTYIVDSKTHKKGFTAEETEISITASSSNASVTVTKK